MSRVQCNEPVEVSRHASSTSASTSTSSSSSHCRCVHVAMPADVIRRDSASSAGRSISEKNCAVRTRVFIPMPEYIRNRHLRRCAAATVREQVEETVNPVMCATPPPPPCTMNAPLPPHISVTDEVTAPVENTVPLVEQSCGLEQTKEAAHSCKVSISDTTVSAAKLSKVSELDVNQIIAALQEPGSGAQFHRPCERAGAATATLSIQDAFVPSLTSCNIPSPSPTAPSAVQQTSSGIPLSTEQTIHTLQQYYAPHVPTLTSPFSLSQPLTVPITQSPERLNSSCLPQSLSQPYYNPCPPQPCYNPCPPQPCYNPCPPQPCYNPCPPQPCYNPCPPQPCYNPCPPQPCYNPCRTSCNYYACKTNRPRRCC